MISEEGKKKAPGGRPKKALKRDVIAGVRYTKEEYNTLKQNANNAGLKLTTYIRIISLKGTVTERLTEEERQFLRDLRGLANNVNQLTKMAHMERLATAYLYFQGYGEKLDKFLSRVK